MYVSAVTKANPLQERKVRYFNHQDVPWIRLSGWRHFAPDTHHTAHPDGSSHCVSITPYPKACRASSQRLNTKFLLRFASAVSTDMKAFDGGLEREVSMTRRQVSPSRDDYDTNTHVFDW